jgi:hypothetical protein
MPAATAARHLVVILIGQDHSSHPKVGQLEKMTTKAVFPAFLFYQYTNNHTDVSFTHAASSATLTFELQGLDG